MDAIQEVFRTRGGFSNDFPVAAGFWSLSKLWIDVRVFSLELPLLAGSSVSRAATPPTSEDEPVRSDDDDTDDTDDKSCTSYRSDSCELVLISRLDKLLFFTFNRLGFAARELGGGSLIVGVCNCGSCFCCCCCCCVGF